MKLTQRSSLLSLLLLLALVSSCSVSADSKAAEQGVEKFHTQFNQEQYHDIFIEASEDFQKSASEQDLIKLLTAIHQKLGAVKSSKEASWHVNYSTNGTTVTLSYETVFEQGKGTEQFIWIMNGKQAKLLRYDINSTDLIQKLSFTLRIRPAAG